MSRHDREIQANDADRRKMRIGMAKAALEHKDRVDQSDIHHKPLTYAIRMAEGHSKTQLRKWVRGGAKTFVRMR